MSDDYVHSFIWDGEHGGNFIDIQDGHTWKRIESLADIFTSVYSMYMTWSGRIEGSFFTHLFLLIGKPIFNIINTMMFSFVIMLIARIGLGKYHWENWKYLIGIFAGFWTVNFAFFNTTVWVAGSSNYLWPMFFQLLFLLVYIEDIRNNTWEFLQSEEIRTKILPFLLGVLAGNTNENSTLATLIAVAILYFKAKKKWMLYGLIGITIGYLILVLAPGNYVRYQTTLNTGEDIAFPFFAKIFVLVWFLLKELPFIFLFTPYLHLDIRKKCYDANLKRDYDLLLLFIFMGAISALAMLAAPEISPRSMFGTTVFWLIAAIISVHIMSIANIRYYRRFIVRFVSIFFMGFTLFTMAISLRTEIILQDGFQKHIINFNENKKTDIVIPWEEYPFMQENVARNEKLIINHDVFGNWIGHISDDPDYEFNQALAEYYQLNSIRLDKPKKR